MQNKTFDGFLLNLVCRTSDFDYFFSFHFRFLKKPDIFRLNRDSVPPVTMVPGVTIVPSVTMVPPVAVSPLIKVNNICCYLSLSVVTIENKIQK